MDLFLFYQFNYVYICIFICILIKNVMKIENRKRKVLSFTRKHFWKIYTFPSGIAFEEYLNEEEEGEYTRSLRCINIQCVKKKKEHEQSNFMESIGTSITRPGQPRFLGTRTLLPPRELYFWCNTDPNFSFLGWAFMRCDINFRRRHTFPCAQHPTRYQFFFK